MSGLATDALYTAGVTIKIVVADTVINFATAALLAAIMPTTGVWANRSATSLLIHAVDSDVYYAFGADPATDGSVGHPLEVGAQIEVKNFATLKNMRFIRKGANTGGIMVTPFYNNAGN
jgi:hypothetical protein